MRHPKLFLFLLLVLTLPVQAQRVLLKPADYPRNVVADSVYNFAQSVRSDCVFRVTSFYDNGYYNENSQIGVVMWQAGGKRYARMFKAGAMGAVPETRLPLDSLFSFYFHNRLSELSYPVPPAKDGPVQGPAYSVDVSISDAHGSHTEGFNVRAPARHLQLMLPGKVKGSVTAQEDPRCVWLNLLEQVMPQFKANVK